jgi:plasmid stabilization system protein ParE
MKPYRLSATAMADFYETSDFWLGKSIAMAERWEAGITKALQHIADWPHSGHKHSLLGSSLRLWTTGDYVIVYHDDTEPVFVLAILHGTRDIPRIMQER